MPSVVDRLAGEVRITLHSTRFSACIRRVLAGRDMAHATSTMQARLHNLYQQVSNEAAVSCSSPVSSGALESPSGSAMRATEALDSPPA